MSTIKATKEDRSLMNTNKDDVETDDATDDAVVVEDDWGLPCDFAMFAQHQLQTLWLGHDMGTSKPLKIWCVEALTPLDMVQLGNGVHDATGHCVWTACFLWLAALATKQLDVSDISAQGQPLCVLELGSGTGLGGLALLRHVPHAQVTLTDADPAALDLCRRNVTLNEDTINPNQVTICPLTWGTNLPDDLSQQSFHVVLAADILYDIRMLPAIIQTATAATTTTTTTTRATFYLSHVPRACYNHETADNAPEVIDLESYIVNQVVTTGVWHLQRIWRPLDLFTPSSVWQPPAGWLNTMSLKDMQAVGAALFVFARTTTTTTVKA